MSWRGRRANNLAPDFGLALHAIADPDSTIQTSPAAKPMFRSPMAKNFSSARAPQRGRGAYDRSRMTLNAIDLLRTALIEGMK